MVTSLCRNFFVMLRMAAADGVVDPFLLDKCRECGYDVSGFEQKKSPSWIIRGVNFAGAMSAHAADGFRRCSQEQIDARLAICQACPQLVNNHCSLCGCACVAENQLVNKLALKSSECPIAKWGKL